MIYHKMAINIRSGRYIRFQSSFKIVKYKDRKRTEKVKEWSNNK